MHFFLILHLWLAPFFNISSLSDLKYNLHKYREKSDFFGKNRIFSGKYRIFSEKSAIFADFFPIFLQKIFPPENLFHHHRKPIFRRKIGRKNRFFCPCIALWDTQAVMIITSPPMVGLMDFYAPYMQWYRRIKRHFMILPLHRDEMRFHTTTGSTHVLVS